jgi:hypothetical protein
VPRATADVDVMVTSADYNESVGRLRADSRLEFRANSEGVAQFSVRLLDGIGLDVLDAESFSGGSPGEAFFDFLEGESSSEIDGVRFATVEAVWYTRLMVRRWSVYAEKILADVVANANLNRLAEVQNIARRFGTEELIAPRINYVREEAKLLEFDAS